MVFSKFLVIGYVNKLYRFIYVRLENVVFPDSWTLHTGTLYTDFNGRLKLSHIGKWWAFQTGYTFQKGKFQTGFTVSVKWLQSNDKNRLASNILKIPIKPNSLYSTSSLPSSESQMLY